MGNNTLKTVWIGIYGLYPGNRVLKASTNLKGLCDEVGANYFSVRGKGDGPFEVWVGEGDKKVMWEFVKLPVRKVDGRGRFV